MRMLVTGAAGFIGSHLCEELVRRGHQVHGLDDLSTGRTENLRGLREKQRFSLTTGSVLDAKLVRSLARGADVVYHLAAAVGTFTVRDGWLCSMLVNLDGTRNAVEAAAEYGIPLLFASSSEVYGNSQGVLREDSLRVLGSPQRPRWSYAEAKALDESLIAAYAQDGLPAVTARLFNIAGPRQRAEYGMVIPRFVSQALKGEPVTVHGTGDRVRSFCHVDDAVPALAQLPLARAAHGRAVNIGSASTCTSITQLAQTVIEMCGSSSEIAYEPLTQAMGAEWDDMDRGVPDTSAAAALVGFRATYPLRQIIRSVIEEGDW
jgi:nucleoside-diphosphate-sugar epimerase